MRFTPISSSGPGVEGLAPREASDRLQAFQMQFDELWRKYVTYSGGEELFGLTVKGRVSEKWVGFRW